MDRLQEEGELSAQGCRWGVQPPGRRSSWGGWGKEVPGNRREITAGSTQKRMATMGSKGQAQWAGIKRIPQQEAQRHFAANQGFTRRS